MTRTLSHDAADARYYRAVSGLAVASLGVGIFSLPALMFAGWLPVPFFGIVLSVIALIRLRRRQDELVGSGLASAGMILAGSTFGLGALIAVTGYWLEVPEGYTRIHYTQLQPDPAQEEKLPVPRRALELDGQRVFLKGYIYPDNRGADLSQFIMVPDMGTCCFGGQPKLTDMVEVTLKDPLRARYSFHPQGVAGVLRVDTRLKPITGLQGVYYRLEAEFLNGEAAQPVTREPGPANASAAPPNASRATDDVASAPAPATSPSTTPPGSSDSETSSAAPGPAAASGASPDASAPPTVQESAPSARRSRSDLSALAVKKTAREALPDRPRPSRVSGGVRDISFDDLEFKIERDQAFERSMLTPRIEELDGERVVLRGFVLDSSVFQTSGIKQFMLVRDNQQCCFGPGAYLYHNVQVEMEAGQTAEFSIRPVLVNGTFSIKPLIFPDGKCYSVYHIRAQSVRH